MKDKIKVGVIGVGSLGQWHARVYSELENAELVGVYDLNTARAEEIAARYKTKVFLKMEELADNVEAASIVVPADKHYEVSMIFLKRNIHLLIEKPVATTTQEAEEMVRLAEEKKLILQVGHIERFNPVMRYLEEQIRKPKFIEAHRLAPYPPIRSGALPRGTEVSVVLDLMIHDLEIILHLVQSEVQEIHAIGVPILSKAEDIANVRLTFKNQTIANITASRISPEPMRKIRVFTEDAYISLDYQKQTGEIYKKNGMQITRDKVPIEKDDALGRELASFILCVSNRETPIVGGRQAADALKLAVMISQKMRSQPS
jgi:predicted dehydrogenase